MLSGSVAVADGTGRWSRYGWHPAGSVLEVAVGPAVRASGLAKSPGVSWLSAARETTSVP